MIIKRNIWLIKQLEYCKKPTGLRHGPAIQWHSIGKKAIVSYNVDGQRHWKYVMYDREGQIAIESNYVNGYKNGKETRWWSNGQKMAELTYENEEIVHSLPETPKGMRWACWGKDGKLIECPW